MVLFHPEISFNGIVARAPGSFQGFFESPKALVAPEVFTEASRDLLSFGFETWRNPEPSAM
jgi:hypothetical protein